MPTIRDGRGQLSVHDMTPPAPGEPAPVARSRVSEARMADFAAERARMATEEERRRSRAGVSGAAAAAMTAASRARGAQRAGFVKGGTKVSARAHHDAGTNRVREQVADGKAAAKRAPRPAFDRQATVEAVRSTTTLREAAAKLGLNDTSSLIYRLTSMEKAGELPDDVAARRTGTGSARRIARGLPPIAVATSTVDVNEPKPSQRTPPLEEPAAAAPDDVDLRPAGGPVNAAALRGEVERSIAPIIVTEYSAPGLPPTDELVVSLSIRVTAAELATWPAERVSALMKGIALVTSTRWPVPA